MIKISHVDDLKEIIRENKDKQGSIVRNMLFMVSDFCEYISEGRLFVETYPDGVILLVDEVNYYNAFFLWKKGVAFPQRQSLIKEKPLLVEEILFADRITDDVTCFEASLESVGFLCVKESCQYALDLSQNRDRLLEWESSYLDPEGCKRFYCGSEQSYREAVRLWEAVLDVTDVPYSHQKPSDGNKLLGFFDSEGKVISTMFLKMSGKNCEGWHIATVPECRGRGLASAMIRMWCCEAIRDGKNKCYDWISKDNLRSIALHMKVGFIPTTRISKQFLLK